MPRADNRGVLEEDGLDALISGDDDRISCGAGRGESETRRSTREGPEKLRLTGHGDGGSRGVLNGRCSLLATSSRTAVFGEMLDTALTAGLGARSSLTPELGDRCANGVLHLSKGQLL